MASFVRLPDWTICKIARLHHIEEFARLQDWVCQIDARLLSTTQGRCCYSCDGLLLLSLFYAREKLEINQRKNTHHIKQQKKRRCKSGNNQSNRTNDEQITYTKESEHIPAWEKETSNDNIQVS